MDKNNSQVNYKETPYEETKWDILGNYEEKPTFVPMLLDVMDKNKHTVDPVFEDLGGSIEGVDQRLHLPEEESVKIDKYIKCNNQDEEMEKAIDELVQRHEEELARAKEEYYQKGKDEVLEACNQEKEEYKEEVSKKIEELIDSLRTELNNNKEQLEKEALALSLKVANKILQKETSVNKDYILDIISKALQSMPGAVIKSIKVSKESFEYLKNINTKEMFKDTLGDFKFEEDSSIERGCKVESLGGEVNFDLDEAFERISSELIK